MKTLKFAAAVFAVASMGLGISTAVASTSRAHPALNMMPAAFDQIGAKYTCGPGEGLPNAVLITEQHLTNGATAGTFDVKYVHPNGTVTGLGGTGAYDGASYSAIGWPIATTSGGAPTDHVADGGYVRIQDTADASHFLRVQLAAKDCR